MPISTPITRLSCEKPGLLKLLTLAEFFKRFPATQKIQVQLIGPDGQKGADLAPASAEPEAVGSFRRRREGFGAAPLHPFSRLRRSVPPLPP